MSGHEDSHAPTLVALSVSPPSDPSMASTVEAVILAGRYAIVALLGVGGMGAVYRARDLELDELIALKMLRHDLVAVPGILERFRQEVKLARKVTSPHVARTFDIGEHDGERFLTMELVDGESLGNELERSGAMPAVRVVAIAKDVCSGLAAAHGASVVHRDLKPDNVLLGRDGSIKITDFGIATAQADAGVARGISGTPAYMAPEQVTAEATIDARADVYAFGVMLYEMLTGQLPWQGDSAYSVASARLGATPPDVRRLRPDVPPVLAALVLRCMATNRDERPKDARELAATLDSLAWANDTPPVAPMPVVGRMVHGKTIAVPPLRNRGALDDDYLADGLTDDLIDSLSMVNGLRVCSRGAVMRFKGEERDPRVIGRELGVDVFVDGTARREAELLRVNVRLVSVEDAFQLWAKRFERPASEVLAVGEEVARAIAGALDVEAARKPDTNRDPAVVDLYLRARHATSNFGVESTERAVSLFEQALALAPDDPLILAGAALAYLTYITMHPEEGEGFAKAVAVAERAVALAPELADGHVALANLRLHEGRDMEAVREVRLAIAAAPSNVDARCLLGRFYAESGRPREAIVQLEIAQALDPRLTLAIAEHARVHALLGEWELCERRLDLMVHGEADSPYLYWGNLMRFLIWENNPEKSVRAVAAARASIGAQKGDISALIDVLEGRDISEHQTNIDRWLALPNSRRRHAFFWQLKAEVAGFQGHAEQCLQATTAADALGLTDRFWIDRCPAIELVRADPRFATLRARITARAEAIVAALQ